MELEKLEKAKELQQNIAFLKDKIEYFDSKNRWVYLHIKDHYGNGHSVIETYAFSNNYTSAAGTSFDSFVADSYGEFLEKVRIKMQERIDFLQSELNKL